MHVLEIWRYPIKSLGGERLDHTSIGEYGITSDRGWGLIDDRTGLVLTARREPRLLMADARVVDGEPLATTVDGHELRTSADFSEWLDRPVTLASAAGHEGGTYENPLDAENETGWVSWQGPSDAWHDSARTRVSIVGALTLGEWDTRRFRANVVVDGGSEDELVGANAVLGDCRLHMTKRVSRCVMVTRPQPGLERDLDVLRTVTATRDGCLAVGATVTAPGRVTVGDLLTPS